MNAVDNKLNCWVSEAERALTVSLLPLVENFLYLNDRKEVEESNIVIEVETVPESREHKCHYMRLRVLKFAVLLPSLPSHLL